MVRDLERIAIQIVRDIVGGDLLSETPRWLMRPGREECGRVWNLVKTIYNDLTGLDLSEVMPSNERRKVDAILKVGVKAPRILEIDESQHFNQYRARTLRLYPANIILAFDKEAWLRRCEEKKKLEGGGFAKPKPPLFPGPDGRHRQRAFRDAICDLLPPEYGFLPTLRLADFEIVSWLRSPNAKERMAELLQRRLHLLPPD